MPVKLISQLLIFRNHN